MNKVYQLAIIDQSDDEECGVYLFKDGDVARSLRDFLKLPSGLFRDPGYMIFNTQYYDKDYNIDIRDCISTEEKIAKFKEIYKNEFGVEAPYDDSFIAGIIAISIELNYLVGSYVTITVSDCELF